MHVNQLLHDPFICCFYPLNYIDLCKASHVCRRWRSLSSHDSLWSRQIALHIHLGIGVALHQDLTCKQRFPLLLRAQKQFLTGRCQLVSQEFTGKLTSLIDTTVLDGENLLHHFHDRKADLTYVYQSNFLSQQSICIGDVPLKGYAVTDGKIVGMGLPYAYFPDYRIRSIIYFKTIQSDQKFNSIEVPGDVYQLFVGYGKMICFCRDPTVMKIVCCSTVKILKTIELGRSNIESLIFLDQDSVVFSLKAHREETMWSTGIKRLFFSTGEIQDLTPFHGPYLSQLDEERIVCASVNPTQILVVNLLNKTTIHVPITLDYSIHDIESLSARKIVVLKSIRINDVQPVIIDITNGQEEELGFFICRKDDQDAVNSHYTLHLKKGLILHVQNFMRNQMLEKLVRVYNFNAKESQPIV